MVIFITMARLNKKGLTLVEILITIFLAGIILTDIALTFDLGIVSLSDTTDIYLATDAAAQEIETIRNMSFANILALGSTFTFTTAEFSSLINPTGTVAIDNPNNNNDTRRLTVTVAWTSQRGNSLSKTLATLITRNGIDRQ